MANVYATKSGVWGDTTVWNTGILPDVVDDVFSNTYTVTIDISPTVLSIRNAAAAPIVAGGGFILNDNITLTCTDATNGIRIGTVANNVLTYSGTITATINSHVIGGTVAAANILKNGNGILNIVGNISGNTRSAVILGNTTGTTNIVGNILKTGGSISATAVLTTGASNTINITGNLNGDGPGGGSGKKVIVSNGGNVINIIGNIDGTGMTATNDRVLELTTNDICSIIGSVSGVNQFNGTQAAIYSTQPCILSITGPIISTGIGCAVYSTNINSINIFSGPFISYETGAQPLYVTRMNYFRTLGSYFEFRDDSTNGALPPALPAPATRLVAPNTGADLPAESDVRKNVLYALNTMQGTMNVPHPDNVRKNIPVDLTVGTAILDADEVWDVLTSGITISGSIGERLKNVSTVDTTGDQLISLF